MEMLCKFIEDQLDLAVKHRDDRALVKGFKHNAYGAAVYASYCAIGEGNYELACEIDNEWDNKYRIHFEALEGTR
jgi:hypothetical protein